MEYVQLALRVSLAGPPVENTGQMYCNLANTGYMWDTGDKRKERHMNQFFMYHGGRARTKLSFEQGPGLTVQA